MVDKQPGLGRHPGFGLVIVALVLLPVLGRGQTPPAVPTPLPPTSGMDRPKAPSPSSEEKLVITPGGRGARPLEPSLPPTLNRDDFIIIRPNRTGTNRELNASSPTGNHNAGSGSLAPMGGTVAPPGGGLADSKVVAPAPAAGQQDLEFDYWFVVAIEGQRAGYVHWSARLQLHKDKPLLVCSRYLRLTVARFGQTVTQWGEESTVETPEGTVLLTSMRQGLGKDAALALSGTVEGKVLKVRGEGAAAGATDTPWPEGVVGLAREVRLFRELQLKPGETYSYRTYVPTVNRVVTITMTYEGEEQRILWPGTSPRRLLRFVSKPEVLDKVRLPVSITWVDAQTREPLQIQTDFPALGGRLTFLRTTPQAATAPVTRPVEIFAFQSIPLDRPIPQAHTLKEIVYRVHVAREEEAEGLFVADSRQQIRKLDGPASGLELQVQARRGPLPGLKEPAPPKEYLESNFFLNWDNPAVKRLTAQALAGLSATADAWSKARAIERWVHQNMRAFELSQALTPADQVAQHLTGDCTEYAMLAAAMCRAAGIPSRTAMGVVYAPDKNGRPTLAYHMWFEVYVAEQWVPLDATRGEGGVGPTHLKITHDSWHDERSFAPLLPVLRVLTARPRLEVVQIRP
ncbi:MAG: transglutaminase-like domain-containing protein [Thermogemmata sp.]|nr:transglutaminase-like domain-containing protein [Thermogemmata sp.]